MNLDFVATVKAFDASRHAMISRLADFPALIDQNCTDT
jgi:hypothetical protein